MYMNRVVDFLKFKDKNILKRFNKDEITIYTKETDEDAFTRMQFEFLNKNKYKNDIREVDNTHRIKYRMCTNLHISTHKYIERRKVYEYFRN